MLETATGCSLITLVAMQTRIKQLSELLQRRCTWTRNETLISGGLSKRAFCCRGWVWGGGCKVSDREG